MDYRILQHPEVLLTLDLPTLLNTCIINKETFQRCVDLKGLLHQRHSNLDDLLTNLFNDQSRNSSPNKIYLELILKLMNQKELLFRKVITSHRIPILEFLLTHDLDPNFSTQIWTNPLSIAIREDDPEAVHLLLKYGADSNITYDTRETPLIYASNKGNLEIVKLLMNHGAMINTQDGQGYTALMVALLYGHNSVAWYLIEHGADIQTIRNEWGQTAADYYTNVFNDVDLHDLLWSQRTKAR